LKNFKKLGATNVAAIFTLGQSVSRCGDGEKETF
jgi:hypothetical protein